MNFIEVSRKASSLLDGGREKTGVGEGDETEGVSIWEPRILHVVHRGGHGGIAVGVGEVKIGEEDRYCSVRF